MRLRSRQRATAFFIAFGACLVALAVALNVGWIILNWRQVAQLVFGVIFFMAIIVGIVLNTIFLVREIRRNEQHDSFINAVTHELKTPIASIRLHLQTLERRKLDESQRQDFYRLMLEDTGRLMDTVEQVLKAGRAGARKEEHVILDFAKLVEECVETVRTSHHLRAVALRYELMLNGHRSEVRGDPQDLRTAVSNIRSEEHTSEL